MNYLKGGEGVSRQSDEAAEIGRPLTPRSERPRSSYGSLSMSVQNIQGLCRLDRKCVKKENHAGSHWPASTE